MVRRFRCVNCGEHGWILSDETDVAPRCLRCRHRLEVEPAVGEDSPSEGLAIDDTVVSWLSQPPSPRAPMSDAVARCVLCGFEGLMPCASPRGDTFCPTCLAIYRAKPEPVEQRIRLPELSEADRSP